MYDYSSCSARAAGPGDASHSKGQYIHSNFVLCFSFTVEPVIYDSKPFNYQYMFVSGHFFTKYTIVNNSNNLPLATPAHTPTQTPSIHP